MASGFLRGSVERVTKDGFVFQIAASEEDRARLVVRIGWLKQKSVHKQVEHRAHKRFEPRDPRSTIRLASGELLPCFVIDLSRSGAAVSCKHAPRIDDTLWLGPLAGRVVRKLPLGFALQFDLAQDGKGLEQLIACSESVSAQS